MHPLGETLGGVDDLRRRTAKTALQRQRRDAVADDQNRLFVIVDRTVYGAVAQREHRDRFGERQPAFEVDRGALSVMVRLHAVNVVTRLRNRI